MFFYENTSYILNRGGTTKYLLVYIGYYQISAEYYKNNKNKHGIWN